MLVRLDKTAHRGYNIQRNDTQKHVTTIYCGVFIEQKQDIPHAPFRFAVTRIENPEREKRKNGVYCVLEQRERQNMITKIRKRDGREVPFNLEKISNAIFRAAQAVGGSDYDEAMALACAVVYNPPL